LLSGGKERYQRTRTTRAVVTEEGEGGRGMKTDEREREFVLRRASKRKERERRGERY
jgi:hypothetical protein